MYNFTTDTVTLESHVITGCLRWFLGSERHFESKRVFCLGGDSYRWSMKLKIVADTSNTVLVVREKFEGSFRQGYCLTFKVLVPGTNALYRLQVRGASVYTKRKQKRECMQIGMQPEYLKDWPERRSGVPGISGLN